MSTESPQEPNEPDDLPDDSRGESDFTGAFLRFTGMLTIVGAITYASVFENWQLSTDELVVLIIIGLIGGAAHFAGRKMTPGKHTASVVGGLFGVVLVPIAGLIFVIMLFGSLLKSCGIV